jgi:cytoskeletal protein CcmA (bactofilin family)
MALFGIGKDREEQNRTDSVPPVVGTPAPGGDTPREAMMGDRDTTQPGRHAGMDAFLGKGSKVTGKLVFDGAGRIEGQVEGEITAQDTLTIGEGAVVNAKITGTTVIIEGRVTGDVNARQRLELRTPSRVQGNITSPCLVVQEGAIFEGQCAMSGAEVTSLSDKRLTTATTAPRPADSPVHAVVAGR